MRIYRIFTFLFLFLLLSTTVVAQQQVTQLRIKKAMPELNDDPSLYLEVFLPMDQTGLAYNNPMDVGQSALTLFADDAGTDFLAAHQKAQEELKARGYAGDDPIFRFGGFADIKDNKDLILQLNVEEAPAADAQQITIAGTLVFNFMSEEEPAVIEVTGVPVEMGYNEPGFATDIGPIRIEGGGSAQMGEKRYEKFRVIGTAVPIVGIEVIGGDDSEAIKGFWARDANEFVFSEIPQTVDLRIRYTSFKKVTVPLELKFGIGL